MIIDLRTIQPGSRTFEYVLEKDWWRSEEFENQILALDAPLAVSLRLYTAGDKIALDGRMNGGIQVRCDRCLQPYHRDLNAAFHVFLALPSPESEVAEVELLDEDMEVNFIRGEEIDVDEIVREQVYLSLPMKLLCSDDCKGLCPRCGADLNKRACQCRREVGHPGFSKLKNLKIQE